VPRYQKMGGETLNLINEAKRRKNLNASAQIRDKISSHKKGVDLRIPGRAKSLRKPTPLSEWEVKTKRGGELEGLCSHSKSRPERVNGADFRR